MTIVIRHKIAVALTWVMLALCVAACGGTPVTTPVVTTAATPDIETTVKAAAVVERTATNTAEPPTHEVTYRYD